MKFPKWAPKDLCDYYNQLAELKLKGEEEEEERELLERLLTNETMIPVWKAFAQKDAATTGTTTPLETHPIPPPQADLWRRRFGVILRCYRESGKQGLTRTEIIGRLEIIAKKAKELSRAFKNTPFDTLPFKWPNGSEQEKSLERIRIEHDVPKKHILLNSKILGFALGHTVPLSSTWSAMMKNIADEAKARFKVFQRGPECKMHPTVSNWGSKNARANYFIRTMSGYFEQTFGSTHYRLLGRLASVAMDNPEIDETTVRSSLQEWRNSTSRSSK